MGEARRTGMSRLAAMLILAGGLLAGAPAFAQRAAAPEVSRPNRSCTDIYQMCLKRQGQANCEGFRQDCIRTGTWQSPIEVTRDLQRR